MGFVERLDKDEDDYRQCCWRLRVEERGVDSWWRSFCYCLTCLMIHMIMELYPGLLDSKLSSASHMRKRLNSRSSGYKKTTRELFASNTDLQVELIDVLLVGSVLDYMSL